MSEDYKKRIGVLAEKIVRFRKDFQSMFDMVKPFEDELIELLNDHQIESITVNKYTVTQKRFERKFFNQKQALDDLAFKFEVDTSQYFIPGINLVITTPEGKLLYQKILKAVYEADAAYQIEKAIDDAVEASRDQPAKETEEVEEKKNGKADKMKIKLEGKNKVQVSILKSLVGGNILLTDEIIECVKKDTGASTKEIKKELGELEKIGEVFQPNPKSYQTTW